SDAAAAQPAEEEQQWLQPNGSYKPRVLIVDDDPVNLTVLERILALERYSIVSAASGSEALALVQGEPFDLVIADVMMPHMSGYELTAELRRRYSLSELPILLLTARGRPEDVSAGYRAGA